MNIRYSIAGRTLGLVLAPVALGALFLIAFLATSCRPGISPAPPMKAPSGDLVDYLTNRVYTKTLVGGERRSSYSYDGRLADGVHGTIRKFVPAQLDTWAADTPATVVLEVYDTAAATDPSSWLVMRFDPARAKRDAPEGASPEQSAAYGWSFRSVASGTDGMRETGGLSATASSECAGCHARAASSVPMVFATGVSAQGETPDLGLDLNLATAPQNLATPPPVFQQGDRQSINTLFTPLDPEGRERAEIERYLHFYFTHGDGEVPAELERSIDLTTADLAHFPPQSGDDGQVPAGMGHFNLSQGCQSCHDTASYRTADGTLPPMDFWAYPVTEECLAHPDRCKTPEDHALAANWSPFGDWSASILGLSSRDPVWHAQIETERFYNEGVPGAAIDDICFRCHGPMGERQLKVDEDSSTELFDHCFAYLTESGQYLGKPECEEFNRPKYTQSEAYLQPAALGRDGVSCGFCHTIGPEDSPTWDGKSWDVFYGTVQDYYNDPDVPDQQFVDRLKAGEELDRVPRYAFTALNQNNLDHMLGPDTGLYEKPMSQPPFDYGLSTAEKDRYIHGSQVCGTCHIVIVPKVPTGYAEGEPVSSLENGQHPYYTRPEGCPDDATLTGDPITDRCVGLTYEQQTYFEWVNSGYATDELDFTCQECHMEQLTGNRHHVAQYEQFPKDPQTYRREYNRHTLMGINLFVHQMYQQFADVLGVSTVDPNVPAGDHELAHNLLNGEATIVDFATSRGHGSASGNPSATVAVQDLQMSGDQLSATVQVTNNAGHKFPSGAGFRRAWIELEVVDSDDNVLWASGMPNRLGVICDGPCNQEGTNILSSELTTDPDKIQYHYQTISSQDQVQIYEAREVDDTGVLTSRVLSLFHAVKDNRLLPAGWLPKGSHAPGDERLGLELRQLADITTPILSVDDPYYQDPSKTVLGADQVRYEIPLTAIDGTPARVRARLRYQTIPPFFLLARYKSGVRDGKYGPETQRLVYFTSRLNLDLGLLSTDGPIAGGDQFEVMQGWTMLINRAEASLPGYGG